MPPIAAARSGQNIRRTCKLMNDISTSPTTATKIPATTIAATITTTTITTAPPPTTTTTTATVAAKTTTTTKAYGSGKNVQKVISSHLKNSRLYKTELCRTWVDCGRCNYGDKCQYAHGEGDRKPVQRHRKYKTEFCLSFHQVGYCPYGPRCNFIHNEEQSQIGRNQINCNGNNKMNVSNCSSNNSNNDLTATTTTTATVTPTAAAAGAATITAVTATATTTLTFGIWQPYCNSMGDSPAPSSACSSTDSSIGSASPSVDFDENICSAIVATNGWNTFGTKFNNNNMYHFNWPSTIAIATTATTTTTPPPLPPSPPPARTTVTTTAAVTTTGTETVTVTTAQALPLQTQPILDSALFNDLLELTIDEKKTKKKTIITKTVSDSTTVTCASSGRLPVFVQLSNPSSASWNKWFELLSDE